MGQGRGVERERVSRAPLHAAYMNKRIIPIDELMDLRERFPNIKTSKWSEKEVRRLQRNWDYIVNNYPEYSDPKYAFSIGRESEAKLTFKEIEKKRESYENFGIMLRMAYRLPNRLICDIYRKCRRMFYFKSYFFKSRLELPAELEEVIKNELNANEAPVVIAHKYNVAPNVIHSISGHPERIKRFKWTRTIEDDLKQTVLDLYDIDDFLELLARDINWRRIANRMRALGYEIEPSQCYNKWIRLFPDTKLSNDRSRRSAAQSPA